MSETSQAAILHSRLRTEILQMERTPGSRLTERTLEVDYGVSRTPLRSALQRLEHDGLVARDGRSWQITPIDLTEIGFLSELREAIEPHAARLACDRADEAAASALLVQTRSAHPATPDSGVAAGTGFHLSLAELAINPELTATLASAMTRMARSRWLEVRTAHAREQSRAEHTAIAEAVCERDADAAAHLVRAHIRGTHERLRDALQNDSRMLRARGLSILA